MLWKAPGVEEVLHSTKDNSNFFRGAPGLTMPHVLSLSSHSYFRLSSSVLDLSAFGIATGSTYVISGKPRLINFMA
jgi:hypothetical protein